MIWGQGSVTNDATDSGGFCSCKVGGVKSGVRERGASRRAGENSVLNSHRCMVRA